MGFPWLFLPLGAMLLALVFFRRRRWIRRRRIRQFAFPVSISRKFKEAHPSLTDEKVDLVLGALRDFFEIALVSRGRMVSMPSKAVDIAWHEFILFTRSYEAFCSDCLGYFLHHTPAEAMGSPKVAQAGIKRVWRIACAREGIDPRKPDRLPLLFAIDAMLDIPGGYRYKLDCSSNAAAFCAFDIGCGSGCGGMSFYDGCAGSDGGDAGGGGDGCGGGD